MAEVQISVGQVWRNTKGECLTISSHQEDPPLWAGTDGRVYNTDGYALRSDVYLEECLPAGMPPVNAAVQAPSILEAAAGHMWARAATYDKPEGERSMAKTVAVFQAHHGITLTEAQGWHFLQILKDVRLFTSEKFHQDSAEDCVAYAALKAEAKAKEGGAA